MKDKKVEKDILYFKSKIKEVIKILEGLNTAETEFILEECKANIKRNSILNNTQDLRIFINSYNFCSL